MIKLKVQSYCQDCLEFEADVETPTNIYADGEVVTQTDTIIRCEHRKRCECIKGEDLEREEHHWISVDERLPKKPKYDWVLVKTDGLKKPHIAELRDGVWYCDAFDGPLEEVLQSKVVAWFDMQQIKDETFLVDQPITFGILMDKFRDQFPNLDINDMRPNGTNQLYIWIMNSLTNLIATYHLESDMFTIQHTTTEWSLL